MLSFMYRQIEYKKERNGKHLIVTGEIQNNSGKDLHAVVFRMIVYTRSFPAGNVTFIINGFNNNQVRMFEVKIEDLEYDAVAPNLSNCEIVAESAY